MRSLLITVLSFLIISVSFGQGSTTKKIITDVFVGDLKDGNMTRHTELKLMHEPYADDGTFVLTETLFAPDPSPPMQSKGEWTVLRGDATNKNATVVELDGPADKQFFLRLKNGNLQKLDSSLRKLHAGTPKSDILIKKQTK